MSFFDALMNNIFIQHAFVAGILASVSCGISGAFMVMKRITFISGSIAHAVLAGVGIAYYFGANPLTGAIISALLFSIILGVIRMKARHREDTVIGVLWAMGMSTGIVFMHMTPGYNTDLMTYLFGNILLISQTDLYILVALNAVVIFTVVTLHRQFVAVSFDEEYSSLTGISVTVIYILLLSLIALTIVILIQVVGLILVIAMMTIPSAIALIFFHNIYKIILCAIFCGIVFNSSGLIISYMTNLPAGSMIILLSGSVYLLLLLVINVVLKR